VGHVDFTGIYRSAVFFGQGDLRELRATLFGLRAWGSIMIMIKIKTKRSKSIGSRPLTVNSDLVLPHR